MQLDRLKSIYSEIEAISAPKVDYKVITALEITDIMNEYLNFYNILSSFSGDLVNNLSSLREELNRLEDAYSSSIEDLLFTNEDVAKRRTKEERKAYADFLVRDIKHELADKKTELINTQELFDFIKRRIASLSKEKSNVLKQWEIVQSELNAMHKTDPSRVKTTEVVPGKGFRGEENRVAKPISQPENPVEEVKKVIDPQLDNLFSEESQKTEYNEEESIIISTDKDANCVEEDDDCKKGNYDDVNLSSETEFNLGNFLGNIK